MLAALADIPRVTEMHFIKANKFCTQLYESRKDGEEEEILMYRAMINDGKRDLDSEMKQEKLEEGMARLVPGGGGTTTDLSLLFTHT